MAQFTVKLTPTFLKSLNSFPPHIIPKVLSSLKILETNPLPIGKPQIKKIKGIKPPLYRLRVSDYRILYRIRENEVAILKILDRKELEKELKKMIG